MDQQMYYEDANNRGEVPSVSSNIHTPILLPTPGHHSLTGLMPVNSSNRIMREAVTEVTRGNCDTIVCTQALKNMAILSSIESHLQITAPSGTERYKRILDAYSINLAMRLMGR